MGWRDGLRGEGQYHEHIQMHIAVHMHQLTKERSDCSVDPFCPKYVGQSNSE